MGANDKREATFHGAEVAADGLREAVADVDAAQVEAATIAACEEAGWDWNRSIPENIPSAWDVMQPIVRAALTAAAQVQHGRMFVTAPDVEPGDDLPGSWTPSQPAPRTVTEWGIDLPWTGEGVVRANSEADAQAAKRTRYDEPGVRVMRREVTEWTEVTR